MSYIFLNHYCKVTSNISSLGNVVITGWIIQADELSINLLDENFNHHLIQREHLIGSITVLLEQKPVPEVRRVSELDLYPNHGLKAVANE